MIATIDAEVRRILTSNDPADRPKRKALTSRSLYYHAIAYHPEFFTHPVAPHHLEQYDDFEMLIRGELRELQWIMYRDSAKTSIAKIGLEWVIVNRYKRNINYDSFVKENAEAALFDIATWLQTNKRLIADWGQLYFKSEDRDYSTIKRLNNFITENGVKVEAFSTQQSVRGRIIGAERPDLFVLDDFETNKTKDSYAYTKQVLDHIKEMRPAIGVAGGILYLCNYITEEGSVEYIKSTLEPRDDALVREQPVMDQKTGEIAWPGKFARTKAEAARRNAEEPDQRKHVFSIEGKIEALTPQVFEPEMMNNPSAAGDLVFDRVTVEAAIARDAREPRRIVAGLEIYEEYSPAHRYALGADTSEGNGRDSQATGIIDFSRRPAAVVATYANDRMDPNTFGYEVKRQGEIFGECFVAVEINNTGHATVGVLKDVYPIGKQYTRVEIDKLQRTEEKRLGWRTGANKHDIIFALKQAFENGELVIWDRALLEELKHYKLRDLNARVSEEGMTRHFDKLMATAIAWEMRRYAPESAAFKKQHGYKQAPYEPTSPFESRGEKPRPGDRSRDTVY